MSAPQSTWVAPALLSKLPLLVMSRCTRSVPDEMTAPALVKVSAEENWASPISMLVPDEFGGGSVSGNGPSDLALVAHAFGLHVAPGPLLPCNVVAATLARSGNEQQRSEVLPA